MLRFAYATGDYLGHSFFDAFKQGFFYTFFRGDNNLNTNLWTMHYELIGSLLVFGLIPLLNGTRTRLAAPLFVLFTVAAWYTNVYMCAFVFGCFLAYFRTQVRASALLPGWIGLAAGLAFVVLAFGYLEPARGFYAFMADPDPAKTKAVRIVVHAAASVVLIQVILGNARLYRLLDGRVGRFLGRCSFGLYIIQIPLLFSFSTGLFLMLIDRADYAASVLATFLLSAPMLLLVSWLMALVDESWSRRINAGVRRLG
jgi:peptidoglycan/LPS O-acetylase OafA/YrhL